MFEIVIACRLINQILRSELCLVQYTLSALARGECDSNTSETIYTQQLWITQSIYIHISYESRNLFIQSTEVKLYIERLIVYDAQKASSN